MLVALSRLIRALPLLAGAALLTAAVAVGTTHLNAVASAPSCFNCVLPSDNCTHFGSCDLYTGRCTCPAGFGGPDCLSPLDRSLVRGGARLPCGDGGCKCDDGWSGMNCNVCESDAVCAPMRLGDETLGEDARCYRGGATVRQGYYQCDVLNRKMVELLPGRPPRVTYSCDESQHTCELQFWIGSRESFYCHMNDCAHELHRGADANRTLSTCGRAQCACIPGRTLCGEGGSVDVTEFLTQEVRGPGKLRCTVRDGARHQCKFTEPAMDSLISSIFGDPAIEIGCTSGECMHYSQVPGFAVAPLPTRRSLWIPFAVIPMLALAGGIAALLSTLGRYGKQKGSVRLPEEEAAAAATPTPTFLSFRDLSYRVGQRAVLEHATGCVAPGQVMAIVGASGSGKTTLLELLAHREKRGVSSGQILLNGARRSDEEFRAVSGFCAQDDVLLPTLTVYETVLTSALLRLPREMSAEAKHLRTTEVLADLGLLPLRDCRIGSASHRVLSGGERRRVAIACELVTNPSVLFLDEPSSGLDASNALNVVQMLASLARERLCTVVLTIHQPRSNIVALFDKLVLLSSGSMVYSGPLNQCAQHFEEIGHACPPDTNLADFLVDLTTSMGSTQNVDQDEEGAEAPSGRASVFTSLVERFTRPARPAPRRINSALERLVDAYTSSAVHLLMQRDMDAVAEAGRSPPASSPPRPLPKLRRSRSGSATELLQYVHAPLHVATRPSGWTQFRILSVRTWSNLVRNPMLMMAHMLLACVLGGVCGLLFHQLTNDIAGFQNRFGLFFFTLLTFGFSCLSLLTTFAEEREVFARERANRYYAATPYFASKALFDVLPLRVVPPFLFGSIVYALVGLTPTLAAFWRMILVLVLFTLASSACVFCIGVGIAHTSVASMVSTLTMLASLLFAGLLVNREQLPPAVRWLQHLSFFHAALEALVVNELRGLSLRERKYGVDIEIPAATIISSFGFDAQAFWIPDVLTLMLHTLAFSALALAFLTWLVRERR